MSIRLSTTSRPRGIALHQTLPKALAGALLIWIAAVIVRGTLLALEPLPLLGRDASRPNFAAPSMWTAAGLIILTCLSAALLTRKLHATATLPATVLAGGVFVLAGAMGTGSLGSLLVTLGLFALAWLIGHTLLVRLPGKVDAPVVQAPIAVGLGLGLYGLVLLLLATLGQLNAAASIGCTGAILALVLVINRERLTQRRAPLSSWRLPVPTWFETIILGMCVGLIGFALLSAFVPENTSDAMRQHLPIAREIWQTGAAPEFPPMAVSRDPIQGHLLYAVAYGSGGMTAAKLVHAFVGLTAVVGVAGIGWLCAGRVAATIGAAILASMPLMLWLLGHAFIDLFPVLFAVTAVLCLLLWQRDGRAVWLLCAGALAGFGFAAKMTTMVLVTIALAAGIFLIGRGPWRWRDRVLATMVFGLGTVVTLPWLVRSFGYFGFLARLDTGSVASDQHTASRARSLFDLVRIPWDLTFHGERYAFPIIGHGEVGITLLLVLPLALLAPRTRATALLAMVALVSYLGWWFTPYQIARHLLPTLAITSALSGIGMAWWLRAARSGTWRPFAMATQAGIVVACLAGALFLLSAERARLPVDLILGRETASQYIAREIPTASVAAAASAQLSPDALVGFIGHEWEGAQIYTEARLEVNFAPATLGVTAEEVLKNLDARGIRYFIWNRPSTKLADWRSTLLSMGFLRKHTRILEGDTGAYVFEVRPNDSNAWDERTGNLLADPELESVGDGGPWTTTAGRIREKRGVVTMQPGSFLVQRVSVEGGKPYLLTVSGQCPEPDNRAELTLRWFDGEAELSSARESVFPGSEKSSQFLWHRAPAQANSVSVEVAGRECELDRIGLNASS